MKTRLEHALTDPGEPPVRELPAEVADLLLQLRVPPRLAAHLRAVHDVAYEITAWLATAYSDLPFDREAVLYGAATHDIGKTIHVEELSGPGSLHEKAGRQLLLDAGVASHVARFAATHSNWTDPDITVDDLVVSLADKIWKAKRIRDLEQLLVDHLVIASGQEPWQVFLGLDDQLGRLADTADSRLAFQNTYPITG
ncbi:HD domain-containing protein [Kribbella qitaiheensis]|uniref:HD domain-containing protein n=1 Tax=Kribbella qitaiheensis TaxID=1544730 RepID=A0A7G6WXZ8_9ACTN|nr:HD domain-containing protein [Kribbella qitaiheensis]QNE18863.1 HD domain-containing protein [Kribbella qitaiheensis]